MNKSFAVSLLLGLGMLMLAGRSEAANSRSGSQGYATINYTLNVTTVSTTPAAVYQVILTSGAASEFVGLFDASSTGSLNALSNTQKVRILYGSTTANTVVTFDPPMQFNTGVMAVPSANTGMATIIYQKGRPTGY